MRTDTNHVFDTKQTADDALRIIDVAEIQGAVPAGLYAGRVLLRLLILVFRQKSQLSATFCFRVDVSNVVRTSGNAVLAADAAVRIHRHDTGLRVSMCCTCRADTNARGVLALLTRDTNVYALAVAAFEFPQIGHAVPGT